METNLAWNLTEIECLTLYYDSGTGAAGIHSVFFFLFVCFRFEQSRIVCRLYSFLRKENPKRDDLFFKRLRIELKSERTI